MLRDSPPQASLAQRHTMVEPGNARQGGGSNAGFLTKRHRFR
jgi:hypothetical protein